MKLTSALLCDHATVRENLLHLLGGGITQLRRASMPAPMDVMLALMIDYEPADVGSEHTVDIEITKPGNLDRILVAHAKLTPSSIPPAGQPLPLIPVVLNFAGLPLPDFGQYVIAVSLDGEPSAEIVFAVVQAAENTNSEPGRAPEASGQR